MYRVQRAVCEISLFTCLAITCHMNALSHPKRYPDFFSTVKLTYLLKVC